MDISTIVYYYYYYHYYRTFTIAVIRKCNHNYYKLCVA